MYLITNDHQEIKGTTKIFPIDYSKKKKEISEGFKAKRKAYDFSIEKRSYFFDIFRKKRLPGGKSEYILHGYGVPN